MSDQYSCKLLALDIWWAFRLCHLCRLFPSRVGWIRSNLAKFFLPHLCLCSDFFFKSALVAAVWFTNTSFNVYFVTAYMWLRSPHCLWQCCWGTYWPFVVFFQSPLSLSGIVIPKAVGWLKWIIMTRFGVLSWGHRWAIHASGSLMPMYSDSSSPSFVLLHVFWMGSSEFVYIE